MFNNEKFLFRCIGRLRIRWCCFDDEVLKIAHSGFRVFDQKNGPPNTSLKKNNMQGKLFSII